MTVSLSRSLGAALILGAWAPAAQADLTAQDVWSDWRTYLGVSGYEVSATEQMSGNTLTVGNLTMSIQVEDADSPVTISLGDLQFVENGDGTVSVNFPETIPVGIDFANEGKQFRIVVNWTQTDSSMLVSGDPTNFTNAYSASTVGLSLAGATSDGEPMPADLMKFDLQMDKVRGKTQTVVGDLRAYDQNINIDTLTYDMAFKAPTGRDEGAFSGAAWGLGIQGKTSIPLDIDPQDMAQMLRDGLSLNGTITYSAGKSDVKGVAEGDSFAFTSKSQGGYLTVMMDAGKLLYDLNQKGTSISLAGGELPFPVEFAMAKAGLKLMTPLARSDAEQDFALGVDLTDFTMSDLLWGIFDAAAVLPRDPATVALDLTGKVKILIDILDPATAAQLDQLTEAPGELNALNINRLLVSMVGAKLSGIGAFTFDNTDLASFGGMPRPIGSVDLQLVGANGLIDKIVQMGVVSAQDAMGARMMMVMLGVPGDGPDTLNSKIEINDQGHILANGQPIQ